MRLKRFVLQAVKLAVSLGLILFLLQRITPGRLAPHLRGIDPVLLAVAVVVFFFSSVFGALQWHVLLRAGGVRLPFTRTYRLYFMGLFFNNFLPANVGGDAYKIFDVVRGGNDPHRVLAVTLLDRVFGIAGLCLIAAVASIILLPGGTVENALLYTAIFVSIVAMVALAAFNRRISTAVRKLSGKITIFGLGGRMEMVLGHMGSLRKLRLLFGKIAILTLFVQSMRIVTHIVVGMALGIEMTKLNYMQFFVFVPLLGLVMILPISINGLGVRESAGIDLFTKVGMPEEQAVLMIFITYVVQVVVSLLGGVYFLLGRRPKSALSAPMEQEGKSRFSNTKRSTGSKGRCNV